jgi:Na+/proline symporter
MKKAIISGFLTLGIVAASLACMVENVISRNVTKQNVINQLVRNRQKPKTAKTTIKNLLLPRKRSTRQQSKV